VKDADDGRFEDRRWKRVAVVLRQQATQARDVAARGRGERSPEKLDRARRRAAQSGQRVQQRRLARAIATQDRPALAR
jgi:hypothetical protein